jgi:hypothetical protein
MCDSVHTFWAIKRDAYGYNASRAIGSLLMRVG